MGGGRRYQEHLSHHLLCSQGTPGPWPSQLGCEIHEIEKGLRAVYWWGRYTIYILWALVAYARLDATRQGKVMLESSNLGWII